MNDFQLAEMVLNKEITMEDALEMCDDANEMLRILGIRKSMRYALKSMAVKRLIVKTANSESARELYATATALEKEAPNYYAKMNEVLVRHESLGRRIEDLREQGKTAGFSSDSQMMEYEGRDPRLKMLTDDFKYVMREFLGTREAANQIDNEIKLRYDPVIGKVKVMKDQLEKLERVKTNYAAAAISQSFAEIFDYLAEELGN